ncbi:MAG: aldehyde dehydrogenase [Candidatus Ornithospirochaeta sp.]
MDKERIHDIVEKQRAYFLSGATLDVKERIRNLRKLHEALLAGEERLRRALKEDLGKSGFESDMCEVRLTESEVSYMISHTARFARDRRVHTPLAQFHSRSFVHQSPYGNVLVMSPWNYPLLLTMEPLADALSAGNTVVIKSSAYSAATTSVMKDIITSTFPEEIVAYVDGGREENEALLDEKFDYIFFTGSKHVGRTVMEKASRHLTPVTLELGGKSPVIVEKDADIPLAARRIVFGKFLNCGQTCVAPDYILVSREKRDILVEHLVKETERQYGKKPLENPDWGKIINDKHYKRIISLIDQEKVVIGGWGNEETLQIAPTILKGVTPEDAVMQEEIFGPVLPILTYDSVDEAIEFVQKREHPLALYVFSKPRNAMHIMERIGFGGGCINDTIIHLATSAMGFGGFGESGMGSYHGKKGFQCFSHETSIVDKKRWIDLPMRYQRYRSFHHSLIRFFLK